MVASMVATNRNAAEACVEAGVHALTDVTGFGLLGHALELAEASAVAIAIDAGAVPLLNGARAAASAGAIPGGLVANRAWVAPRTVMSGVDEVTASLLCDPQTSGGLLAAVAPERLEALLEACARRGVAAAAIGRVVGGAAGTARVIPAG